MARALDLVWIFFFCLDTDLIFKLWIGSRSRIVIWILDIKVSSTLKVIYRMNISNYD